MVRDTIIEWECRNSLLPDGKKVYDISDFIDESNADNLKFSLSSNNSTVWTADEIRVAIYDFDMTVVDEVFKNQNLSFSDCLYRWDQFWVRANVNGEDIVLFSGINDKIAINRKDDVVEVPVLGFGAITNKIRIGDKVKNVSEENYKKYVFKTKKAKTETAEQILQRCVDDLNRNTRWRDWSFIFKRDANQSNLNFDGEWIITKPIAYGSHKIVAGIGASRLSLWKAKKSGNERLFFSKGSYIGKTFRIVVLKNGIKIFGKTLWDGDFDWGLGVNSASAFRVHVGGGLGKNSSMNTDSWKPNVDYWAKYGANVSEMWDDLKIEFGDEGWGSISRYKENDLNIDRNILSRISKESGFGSVESGSIISASMPDNENFGMIVWQSRASSYHKDSRNTVVSKSDEGDWCDIASFCFKPGQFEDFSFEFIDKSIGSVLKDLATLLNCVLYITHDRKIYMVDSYFFSEDPAFKGGSEVVLNSDYLIEAVEDYVPIYDSRSGSGAIPSDGWSLHPDIVTAWSDYINRDINYVFKDISMKYLLAGDPNLSYSDFVLLSHLVTDFGEGTISSLNFGKFGELANVIDIRARIKTLDKIRSEDAIQTEFIDDVEEFDSGYTSTAPGIVDEIEIAPGGSISYEVPADSAPSP